MTTMRVASPCSEDLDAMPRDGEGNYLCSKCDRAVVDLRGARRKRALAVIEGLRKQGDGSVCMRVNVKRDGTPVFTPDPSPLARLAFPIALAGSLAACSPQMERSQQVTTPVTLTAGNDPSTNSNTPGPGQVSSVVTPPRPTVHNVNTSIPEITTAVAGGIAFAD